MNLNEYSGFDGLGLAELVARREVSPRELAQAAAAAIEKVNPAIGAVVETYADRIEGLHETALGDGPFRGAPFLIKDVFGHEKGRRIEFGSRLCRGMIATADTNMMVLLRRAGVNNLGRSAAPEFSMAATTESELYGNCSTPWKKGYSAGGSSGGASAAVAAGIVPLAHSSDIGGSIRIPAAMCGVVGFKPSRMRVSLGPVVDEVGWGWSINFVQTRTMRDAAAMLDAISIPAPGDPFVIPKPAESYAALTERAPRPLRIGIVLDKMMGVTPDPEIVSAVHGVGETLAKLGHHVELATVTTGGVDLSRVSRDLFFFDFDNRLDGYGRRSGLKPGPDTLEPTIWSIYQRAKEITPSRFTAAWSDANTARRSLGAFFESFDIWLAPTTPGVAAPWGHFGLSRPDVDFDNIGEKIFAPVTQYTLAHNLLGTPAISLPLAMHSSGLPIGVQLAGRPADDHVVLQVARLLEQAMPWAGRTPPLHVGRM
ncbi:MAG: amidase [Alphaproteobacteria bacterium]|nr:amidase [Alphaproteobacteria bacterium]